MLVQGGLTVVLVKWVTVQFHKYIQKRFKVRYGAVQVGSTRVKLVRLAHMPNKRATRQTRTGIG
jgi:hypothetical protein